MREYLTTGPTTIVADIIGLDEKQAERRAHMLKPLRKKGTYQPLQTLTFKAGETVYLEDVSKTSMLTLRDVTAEKEAEAKAKQEAEAKA